MKDITTHGINNEERIIINKNTLNQGKKFFVSYLHDIGRIYKREGHAMLGRDIVYNLLRENNEISKSIRESNRLLYLIEKHSNKEDNEEDYCLKVLRDADVLDEIGAMSIFMASN